MTELTIPQFLESTASNAPVPGGGSVSALCGALSSALGAMVCGLTLGRKKYAEHEPEIQRLIAAIQPKTDILTRAIALDSEAYDGVMQAYKLPKDTDEERSNRAAAINAASIQAANVPMNVADNALGLLPLLARLAEIGNQNAITDVGVAAMCAQTAVLGACLNVRINLSSISDEAVTTNLRERCDKAETQALALVHKIYTNVHQKVS